MSKKIFEADEAPVQGQPQAPAQATDKPTTATQSTPEQGGSDEETLKRLTDLMSKDYPTFVQELSKLTSDNNIFPKLKNLILGGDKDGNPNDEVFKISGEYDQVVTALIPTQNEIDRNKSLAFPITYPAEYEKLNIPLDAAKKQISEMLTAVPVRINKLPIVVFDYQGKTYILDGHHRWSSVYSLNSSGVIKAIKLTSSKEITPLKALRAVQLSIAVSAGAIPTSQAGSSDTNLLLSSSNSATKKFLEESMTDGFIGIYQEALKKSKNNVSKTIVVEYIMKNIETMQKNGFLKDAPSRAFMPQTDGTENLKKNQELWKAPLVKGDINVLPNFATESKKWVKTYEQFRRK
jgi:hypothetical protein